MKQPVACPYGATLRQLALRSREGVDNSMETARMPWHVHSLINCGPCASIFEVAIDRIRNV